MWGADDTDFRKPMLWPDLEFADERAHPFGQERPVDGVSPDTDMLAFYRRWAHLRARHEALRAGGFEFRLLADERRLVAFQSQSAATGAAVLAVFNAADEPARRTPRDLQCVPRPHVPAPSETMPPESD